MLSAPETPEIDHRTLKLIVGVIALSLAALTSFLAKNSINSISGSYYAGGYSQIVLIGFLFAIAAFLLAYNGLSKREMVLSKIASVSALGVALFPCACPGHPEFASFAPQVKYVHSVSAAIMFLILAFFCYEFNQRAKAKGYVQARRRARIYVVCGVLILVSIVVMAIDTLMDRELSTKFDKLTFVGEAVALVAFGVSWLTASRIFPGLTREDERLSLF
jgi:hypothetical protein